MALNPKFSTGFRNALLNAQDLTSLFDGGELHIFSGSQPADADATEGAGTVLAKVILPTFTDLTTNGALTTDTGWTKGTGWDINVTTANKAHSDGSQAADSDLTQSIANVSSGVEIEITYTISGYSAGNVCAIAGGVEGTDQAANGTYTQTITAGASSLIGVRADLNFIGDIDNIVVKIHAFKTTATGGAIALNGASTDPSANATGTAAWFRLYKLATETGASTSFVRIDGTVGVGTFNLNIANTTITTADPISLDTFTISLAA